MALKAGKVPDLPDLACVGMVSKVGAAYLSEKGRYHVLPIEVKGKSGGRDATFFFLFQPRWFSKDFEPSSLMAEDPKGSLYGSYRRMCNDEDRVSVLEAIAGENFSALCEKFDEIGDPTEKDIENVLREFLNGNDCGYIMQQRIDKDDAGNKHLTEQYNIQRFFPLTDAEIQGVVEQSESEKRRKRLVVTWDTV